METASRLLVAVSVLAVAGILGLGLWNMMRSGSANRSQNLMRARIVGQFIAVALIMGALWIAGR